MFYEVIYNGTNRQRRQLWRKTIRCKSEPQIYTNYGKRETTNMHLDSGTMSP
jgi:hypothetical protein